MTKKEKPDKKIEAYLVIDYKKERVRARKSKPGASDLSKNELVVETVFPVYVPEAETPTLSADIHVPEANVRAAEIAALDEDELPDWTDVADTEIANAEPSIREDANDRIRLRRLTEQIAYETIKAVDIYPEPEVVEDYVRNTIQEIARDERSESEVEDET